jgi:hypothetical protein
MIRHQRGTCAHQAHCVFHVDVRLAAMHRNISEQHRATHTAGLFLGRNTGVRLARCRTGSINQTSSDSAFLPQ